MTKEFNDWMNPTGMPSDYKYGQALGGNFDQLPFEMQEGVFRKFIRETRGVVINVYRNASGWLWSMQMTDGGTDLGWSDFTGDDKWSKTFTSYEKAFMDAVELELKYGCYHECCKDKSKIGHWANYAGQLRRARKLKEDESKTLQEDKKEG